MSGCAFLLVPEELRRDREELREGWRDTLRGVRIGRGRLDGIRDGLAVAAIRRFGSLEGELAEEGSEDIGRTWLTALAATDLRDLSVENMLEIMFGSLSESLIDSAGNEVKFSSKSFLEVGLFRGESDPLEVLLWGFWLICS